MEMKMCVRESQEEVLDGGGGGLTQSSDPYKRKGEREKIKQLHS